MVLGKLPGVVCQMDNIFVYRSNKSEHDKQLCVTLEKLRRAGVTLNAEKCKFDKQTVKFLEHVIDKEGIKADPDKVRAITSFDTQKHRKELQRFFSMVNYFGKCTPTLAMDTQKLRKHLGKECKWV